LCLIDLDPGTINSVRFEHVSSRYSNNNRFVVCNLHVFHPDDPIVVADLDGTITISDIEGHIRTLRLGQYDFIHAGACAFFTKLHEVGCRIVYLTARPIDWADGSRTHLENAFQNSVGLPPGPLITNSGGLKSALFTEVFQKNPHVFKAAVLNTIQMTLINGGRMSPHPVFVAGFGNRPTDVIAYEEVGIEPSAIFLIDPMSNLKAVSGATVYESYNDPNALLWLFPRLKRNLASRYGEKLDAYIARELAYAEVRKQMRLDARLAQEMAEREKAEQFRNTVNATEYELTKRNAAYPYGRHW